MAYELSTQSTAFAMEGEAADDWKLVNTEEYTNICGMDAETLELVYKTYASTGAPPYAHRLRRRRQRQEHGCG